MKVQCTPYPVSAHKIRIQMIPGIIMVIYHQEAKHFNTMMVAVHSTASDRMKDITIFTF